MEITSQPKKEGRAPRLESQGPSEQLIAHLRKEWSDLRTGQQGEERFKAHLQVIERNRGENLANFRRLVEDVESIGFEPATARMVIKYREPIYTRNGLCDYVDRTFEGTINECLKQVEEKSEYWKKYAANDYYFEAYCLMVNKPEYSSIPPGTYNSESQVIENFGEIEISPDIHPMTEAELKDLIKKIEAIFYLQEKRSFNNYYADVRLMFEEIKISGNKASRKVVDDDVFATERDTIGLYLKYQHETQSGLFIRPLQIREEDVQRTRFKSVSENEDRVSKIEMDYRYFTNYIEVRLQKELGTWNQAWDYTETMQVNELVKYFQDCFKDTFTFEPELKVWSENLIATKNPGSDRKKWREIIEEVFYPLR